MDVFDHCDASSCLKKKNTDIYIKQDFGYV